MHKFIAVRSVHLGSAACGDFPNTPGDGWATALAYRRHVERVVARLREDPDAQVQVAEVDDRGRRLRAWAPGDDSVRPSVLAAIRRALGLEPQGTQGMEYACKTCALRGRTQRLSACLVVDRSTCVA